MGRPSVKNKSFWKTQLAQYDPANYNTEMEYHQIFAEKFSKSFDKLRPSIKKFISGYFNAHKQGMDMEQKMAFYRLHPDVFPNVAPAASRGDDMESSFVKNALEDLKTARGKKPDQPGTIKDWGSRDVNAPEDYSFVQKRKRDLLLSLETEQEKNPSDDPKEKAESKESAYDLNRQKDTSLAPEAPQQDPANASVGDREALAARDVPELLRKAKIGHEVNRQNYVQQQLNKEQQEKIRKNPKLPPDQQQLTKDEQEAVIDQANQDYVAAHPVPTDKAVLEAQKAKYGLSSETEAPRVKRTTVTESVRRNDADDTSVAAQAFREFGDAILDTETVDTATPSLRPQYGMEGASAVVPSTAKQLASDLGFDMFSWVNKGFGNGADNKLFLQQEARDKFVRYAGEMYGPGPNIGPVCGLKPMLPRWFSDKPKGFIDDIRNTFYRTTKLAVDVYDMHAPQHATAAALPADIGNQHLFSSKELPRKNESPLEPVYNNYSVFRPVRDAVGSERPLKLARLAHDPIRDPFDIDRDSQSGMPQLPYYLAKQEILR